MIGSLFPSRGSSYPGVWGSNKVEQVNHLVSWIYVAVHTICSRTASIMPNLAYVSDVPKPGVTTKACQRGLMNLGGRGFGGSPTVGINSNGSVGGRDSGNSGSMVEYSSWDPSALCSGGGHSFLTMGEYRSKALSVVKPHEELEPLESDHLLRRLIENPNPVDTSFDLFYELGMFEELTGVSYLWLTPNSWGRPCELWVIPSHWVWPRTGGGQYVPPDNPNADRLIQYYEIRPWGGTGSAGMLKFPPEEVIMTRWKNPLNKIDGYSKLSAGAQWIDSEESVTKSRWAQFQNIARPEFWVELGPGYEDPDDDRIARVEAKFAAKIQGEYNYGKPIITPPGAKLTPLSFNPTEMAYFQSSDQLRDYVLALFNLSKVSVGISDSMTYGSILAVLGSICSFCLNPRLAMRGQALTKHLASRWDEPGRKVKLWWDDCLDKETECLTAEGWKRQEELTEDTRIACYDPDSNTLVYHKPRKIIRRQHDGVLYVWSGGRTNAAMTARHRVYVQPRKKSGRPVRSWEFRLASTLADTQDYKVKRAAPAACDAPTAVKIDRYIGGHQQAFRRIEQVDPRLWLEFIGYYISEGCLQRNKNGVGGSYLIYISQNEDNSDYENIEKCISGMNSWTKPWKRMRKYDKRYNSDKYIQFLCNDRGLYEHLKQHCGKGSLNKKIPNYVKSWPAEDLRVLLDALIAGDGRKPRVNHNTGVWNSQYGTISKQLADDVMEIAIKCGLSGSIIKSNRAKSHHSDIYTVNLSDRDEVLVIPKHRNVILYNGLVWCVEVPTGAFVVRRNGMAHITGNCVPVDPAQVNSDLSTDGEFHAITPNEVRALRGRKPYRYGGDDPLVQGAGGIMPLPLNTGKDGDMDQLAKLVGEYSQSASPQQQGGGMGGMGGEDMGGGQGEEGGGEEGGGAETNGEDEGGLAELLSGGGQEGNAKVENPNGEPTKSYKKNGSRTKKSLTWEQVLRDADGIEIWETPVAAD